MSEKLENFEMLKKLEKLEKHKITPKPIKLCKIEKNVRKDQEQQ